mgnify:FL=1|jgi:hypothetical protein
MKIYTYYEQIHQDKRDGSLKILDLWSKNWKSKGFEPIVLTSKDAELKGDYYKEFKECLYDLIDNVTFLKTHPSAKTDIENNISLEPTVHEDIINKFCFASFKKYLAMANVIGEDSMLVDYDVFNISFKERHLLHNQKKLDLLSDGIHSPVAYGNERNFKEFCDYCIKIFKKMPHILIGLCNCKKNYLTDHDFVMNLKAYLYIKNNGIHSEGEVDEVEFFIKSFLNSTENIIISNKAEDALNYPLAHVHRNFPSHSKSTQESLKTLKRIEAAKYICSNN